MEPLQLTDASDWCERPGTGLTDVLNFVLLYVSDLRDFRYLCMASKGIRSTCSAYLVNNSKAGRFLLHNAVQRCAYELQHPKCILPRQMAVTKQSDACRAAISWLTNVCDNGSVGTADNSGPSLQGVRSILASAATACPELTEHTWQLMSVSNHMQAQEQPAT